MAYSSASGRRPFEYASKSGHSHVISDPAVRDFLDKCSMPATADDVDLNAHQLIQHVPPKTTPIRHVIAIDGGYVEVAIRPQFPSATMAFLQCGALSFSMKDLRDIDAQRFIDPADMARLKNIERLKFALPLRTIRLATESTFTASIRRTIFDFFCANIAGHSLAASLKWLVFEEFNKATPWSLASCPLCKASSVELESTSFGPDFCCPCPECKGQLFITDVLRLHEAIDEELGAGGIVGYLITTIEQVLAVHFVKALLELKPSVLKEVIFIKDGPLAFFGQTANLHKPMRVLVAFLLQKHDLFMAGLEKSGSFVEHAIQIGPLMKPSQILILSNDYIYKYIIPGKADASEAYGRTTYYGNKVIFKSSTGGVHVVTLPTRQAMATPKEADIRNLHVTLQVVEQMRCDMYDNALLPVALANKLVSLSDHPSAKILERFAKSHVQGS
jgi:hypothetical protein